MATVIRFTCNFFIIKFSIKELVLLLSWLLSIRNESHVLPIAVPVLLSIPRDAYYVIRCTTLKLIRELAHWIGQHPDTLSKKMNECTYLWIDRHKIGKKERNLIANLFLFVRRCIEVHSRWIQYSLFG